MGGLNKEQKGGEVEMAKTGKITVTVCELMKDLKTVTVGADATVKDALEAAGISVEGKMEHLRVNGNVAKLGSKVSKEDVIMLVPQVDGGR